MARTHSTSPQVLQDSSPEVDAWFEEDDRAKREAGWRPRGFELDAEHLAGMGFLVWGVLLGFGVVLILVLGFAVFVPHPELIGWWATALALSIAGAWLAFSLFQEEGDGSTDEWAPPREETWAPPPDSGL